MSYRAVKRILGETRLELKCFLLFGTSMLLLILGSFWWYSKTTDELVLGRNPLIGRVLVDTALFAIHVDKLDPPDESININESNTAIEDKYVNEGLREDLPTQEYTFRSISPEPSAGKEKASDEFERSLIREWDNAALGFEILSDPEKNTPFRPRFDNPIEYQYYQPVYAKSACITCHRPYVPNLTE